MKKQTVVLALDICDAKAEVTKNIKHLGMYIFDSPDWKKHIQGMSENVSQSLGVANNAKRYLPPRDTLKCLYNSIVDTNF